VLSFFYVDAFKLYFGSSRGTPSKWLDLAKLMEWEPKSRVNSLVN